MYCELPTVQTSLKHLMTILSDNWEKVCHELKERGSPSLIERLEKCIKNDSPSPDPSSSLLHRSQHSDPSLSSSSPSPSTPPLSLSSSSPSVMENNRSFSPSSSSSASSSSSSSSSQQSNGFRRTDSELEMISGDKEPKKTMKEKYAEMAQRSQMQLDICEKQQEIDQLSNANKQLERKLLESINITRSHCFQSLVSCLQDLVEEKSLTQDQANKITLSFEARLQQDPPFDLLHLHQHAETAQNFVLSLPSFDSSPSLNFDSLHPTPSSNSSSSSDDTFAHSIPMPDSKTFYAAGSTRNISPERSIDDSHPPVFTEEELEAINQLVQSLNSSSNSSTDSSDRSFREALRSSTSLRVYQNPFDQPSSATISPINSPRQSADDEVSPFSSRGSAHISSSPSPRNNNDSITNDLPFSMTEVALEIEEIEQSNVIQSFHAETFNDHLRPHSHPSPHLQSQSSRVSPHLPPIIPPRSTLIPSRPKRPLRLASNTMPIPDSSRPPTVSSVSMSSASVKANLPTLRKHHALTKTEKVSVVPQVGRKRSLSAGEDVAPILPVPTLSLKPPSDPSLDPSSRLFFTLFLFLFPSSVIGSQRERKTFLLTIFPSSSLQTSSSSFLIAASDSSL